MGNYKSRPPSSCADELKKKISEGYAVVRSRLNDDIKPRFDAWNVLQNACFQGTLKTMEESLKGLKNLDERTEDHQLSLLHLICAGHSEQQPEKVAILFEACGDDEMKKELLLKYLSKNGFSALHFAVYKDEIETVEKLLTAGADVDFAGRNKLPPLHLAVMCGNAEMVEKLIDRGASLQIADFVNFTPLHCATYFAHEKIVRLLMKRGADPNACGGVRDRPLHLASNKGQISIVSALLEADADPTLADDEGNTSLHFAAKTGHVGIIDLLLLKIGTGHQELALKTNVYGDTPLHAACYAGRLDAVKRLLDFAGSITLNMENVFSETPLHAACTNGRNLELVAFLLKQPGVDANFQGQDGHTALHSACYHGHLRFVQFLLDNGADQSLTARAVDYSLLPSGTLSGNCLFFENKRYGITPVSSTVAQTMLALSKESGSSVGGGGSSTISSASLNDDQQQTPIIWAYEKGHDQIVALLKHYANKRPDSDVCSEYSSGESSYTPLPSPLGRLRSVTKEKAEILQLRASLCSQFHLSLTDVDFQEAIGSGSFGKVYKGTYRGKIVAIKRYRAVAFGSKSEVDMFCREVSILSKLQHPNVINFVGACLDDPSQFAIITEFLVNGSLFSLLHEQKRVLEMALRLNIGIDVARGMRYLHELAKRPVIHRDLNSHNILLHEDGHAVVADFGESRFMAQYDDENMTKQPGNLRWMAPEIFTQCGRYDRKADVFSYALCIWELHAAELPFAHLKPAAAAAEMAYKRGRPPLPPHPTVQFPAHILYMITSAWHHDPKSRPAFADILPNIEKYASPVKPPNGVSPSNGTTDCGLLSVSKLKNHWERKGIPQESTQHSTASTFSNSNNGIASSSSTSSILSSISSSTKAVDELRQRLDRNGYVLQPIITVDNASIS
ncbi:TKL/MLK/HH498 protein kinase [Loa loa]|uniref:TKL/MLK/HH498 protein kinase n=1 Tax=Loa loa TaxID=7209 RepID=A0A1S0TWU5_LOALO|nr:TKL/MLK/HH498 protein kinase [Loa loa]EFO20785.2 TKL/MLK/HH498 protein kinase [Loa loa]